MDDHTSSSSSAFHARMFSQNRTKSPINSVQSKPLSSSSFLQNYPFSSRIGENRNSDGPNQSTAERITSNISTLSSERARMISALLSDRAHAAENVASTLSKHISERTRRISTAFLELQSRAGNRVSPFSTPQNNPSTVPTLLLGTGRNYFSPFGVAGAASDPLPNEESGSPNHLLRLIRESYGKICSTCRIPGIKFNVRQLEYLVNEVLQPALDDTLPRLERLKPDAMARCRAVLKEFLFLIKSVEEMVTMCSKDNWWIYALKYGDGGTRFSFFYCELAKCIVLAEIVYEQFMNPEQEDLADLVNFTLEDEELVIRSVVCKPGETDFRDLDNRKLQVMCDDILHKETSSYLLQKEKPLAKIVSAKLAQNREDVRRSLSFTIEDYMWIAPEDLAWQKPLGQGGYGTVHEVKWLENTFAGKLFQTMDDESFKREAAILSRLQHPSIVQLWGCCVDRKLNTCSLILDLMNKDLFNFLIDRASAVTSGSKPLSHLVAVDIMLQIAEGMRYLHCQGIMHRDLKAKNVLVELFHPLPLLAEEGFVRVKICDFGMAKTKLGSSNFTSPHLGTSYWRAPEVFNDEAMQKKYTKKADVYSFAMTCAEILTAEPPFHDIPLVDVYRRITVEGMRPSLPSSCPSYLAAYIQRCWATDPNLRPPFHEICRMLRHLRGLLIRTGSADDHLFSCVTEVDLEEMARHLGVKWCVAKSLQSQRVSIDVIVRFLLKASSNEHFASKSDFERALILMGDDLANMKGSKHDYKQAIELFQIGARLGSAEAQWKLGLFFELGLGVEKNEEEAVRLYLEEAAEQDNANAYVELGRCFDCGRGVESSDKMASFYWGRAIMHQIATNKTLQCVSDLINIAVHGSDQELCEIAAIRLWELSIRSRIGRRILAGPDYINIKILVAALGDPKTQDISKHSITLMLPNLAAEPEMGKAIQQVGGVGALVSFFSTRGIQNHHWRTSILTALEKLFSMKQGGTVSEAVRSGIIPSLLECIRHDPRLASMLLIQCLEADAAKAWLSKHKDTVKEIFKITTTPPPGLSSMHAADMKKQLSKLGIDSFL